MTSLKLLHHVKKQAAFISACKCARAPISFLFLWFLWWLNLTWLLSFNLHDGITSRNDVMMSLNMLYLSQLVDVLERWFFFCFYSNLGCQIQKYYPFCILISDHVTTWRYDVMTWLYDVTKLTTSISTCGVTGQMIRSLPVYIHGCLDYSILKCRCLTRNCHSISTGMMTSLYAVTSWSWRLVTISQISFHLTWLDNILQLSNMYVNLVNWHLKIGGILVLLQFHMILWRHIVTSWRDVITCWRQLAKSVSMISLIPTTQISIEFV